MSERENWVWVDHSLDIDIQFFSAHVDSHLLLTAFQLCVQGRSLQIVWSQQVLVGEKSLDVAAIVHDNSQPNAIYITAVDALVENVSILVFDMFQTERT